MTGFRTTFQSPIGILARTCSAQTSHASAFHAICGLETAEMEPLLMDIDYQWVGGMFVTAQIG